MNTYSVSFQGVMLSIWGNSVQIHLGAAHIATLYLAVRSADLGISRNNYYTMNRNIVYSSKSKIKDSMLMLRKVKWRHLQQTAS